MTTLISIPLREVKRIEDIIIFENEETNLMYFKLEFQDEMITCPDGRSAFLSIEVSSKVVICRLPQWSKNSSEEIATSKEKYRIFLRKEREWLINPEIKQALEKFPVPSTEDDIKSAVNFTQIIEIQHEYIHLGCQNDNVENRVYVFENKHWISVPYSDVGISNPITHFDKVSLYHFNGSKPCLLLIKERVMNPLSLYFLPTTRKDGKYLEIPNSKDYQAKYPGNCAIFRHIFKNYVVMAVGSGFGTTPKYFHIYRLNTDDYLPSKIDHKGNFVGDDIKFEHEFFTEDHILVKEEKSWIPYSSKSEIGEAFFSVVSTKIWKVTPLVIEYYVGNTASVVRPEIKDGVITVQALMPETVKITVDSRFHFQKNVTD